MDVRLPDGTILQNVPEGTTRAALTEKLKANGYDISGLGVEQPTPAKIGVEGLPDAIKQVEGEFGPASKFAIGAAGSINSMAMRLKQLFGQNLTPEDIQGLKEYQALESASPSALAGDIGMNVLSTAIPGAGLMGGAANIATRVAPGFLAPTLGAAAGGAAMSAATEPVLEGETTGGKAAMGALGGALGDVVARGLSRVVQPIRQSGAVKKLLKEGVVPTPGQAAGRDSFLGRFEQRLESLPFLGDIIKHGRFRAIEELNRAAVNKSLPRGNVVKSVGRKAIQEADEIFDDAYRAVLKDGEVKIGKGVDEALKRVRANPDVFLTKAEEGSLKGLVENLKRRVPSNGVVTAEAAKGMDSFLGKVARERQMDGAFASGVRELKKELRVSIADGLGGERASILKDIDTKYANFLRIMRASGATGSKEGIFSPEALQSSVRAMDKKGFARGGALMQDLSDPAVDVLGKSVADSGTAGRALVGVGLLGAPAAAASGFYGGPGFLSALAAAPALYSRAGSKYAIGAYPGQQSLAELARRSAPYTAQLGRALANQ